MIHFLSLGLFLFFLADQSIVLALVLWLLFTAFSLPDKWHI